jgi:hypothetical protein
MSVRGKNVTERRCARSLGRANDEIVIMSGPGIRCGVPFCEAMSKSFLARFVVILILMDTTVIIPNH